MKKNEVVDLLLESLSDVCDFVQNILDDQYDFLHHVNLIHQTLFSGFLEGEKKGNTKCTDTDEGHSMSIVGQGRQRPVYLCNAIMCDLSIEWPVMSKQCTSSDYAFEDERDSVLRRCYVDG